MTVRIVTDSSAVLPPERLGRHAIEVVPLGISWDGRTYHNGDLPYTEFAARAAASQTTPTTSAPSPGDYIAACERALEGASGVVIVTPSAEVSATHGNALLAARTAGPRVRVVDSRSAAGGQGLLVLEAARAAESADLDGVVRRAEDVRARVQLWATLERLDYLRRSGRVPSAAAMATGTLNLHPVFRFDDGVPHAAGLVRGGRRAAEKLLEAWDRTRPEAPVPGHALVFHSSRAEEAEELSGRLDGEVEVAEITAAVAAHIGPGMLGLAWWWEGAEVLEGTPG